MKLSIIILNYNVRHFLELCLISVRDAIVNIDAEIIVVDNNSHDDSCKMVRQLFPEIILIQNKENLGFSKGNNIGVAHAKGEFLCILNPDTVVSEDTFIKLINFSEKKEKLGIVGSKLINGIGEFLPESKRNVPLISVAIRKLIGYSNNYYANHLKESEIGEVDVLVGAFMFLKHQVFNVVGGFDEDYFMYGEDIDFSYRVLKLGYINYYYGKSTVIHYKGESTIRDHLYLKHFYGAMQIFYKKHFKKSIFFDAFVSLGLMIVFVLKPSTNLKNYNINEYIYVSNKRLIILEACLPKKTTLKPNMDSFKNNTEIIFDSNVFNFKAIIKAMENVPIDKTITFKILPKQSNFIIGSNNAENRGEIIVFDYV